MSLLREDLLIEAGEYPGDLLHAILLVNKEDRDRFPAYFKTLNKLILPRIDELLEIRPRLALDHMIGSGLK